MELLAFSLVSIAIIVVPGPNVLIVVSTSISHGTLRGLQTVAGTSAAMVIQLLIAALGTAWLVAALTEGFFWLKWVGVVYLLYLGITHLICASGKFQNKLPALGSFQHGFWVSLTNPKTILFFSAFFPQFTVSSQPYLPQIALLSVIFWLLAIVLDSSYALLSHKLGTLLKSKSLSKHQNRASGFLYLGAGATLASTRHGQ